MTTNPDITLEQNISSNKITLDEAETITIQENDFGVSVPGRIIYVSQNATGNNNGTSWENAFTDLQPALNAADSLQEIWVAEGTYFPTTDGDRSQSFVINDGVEVYGGFNGTETERSQRNWLNNRVILSGDIGTQGNRTDNSFNVVTIEENNSFLTVLDGFTIVEGQATGDDFGDGRGGGIYVYDNEEEVNLSNLIVANNFSESNGGAIYLEFNDASVNLANIAFLNNVANPDNSSTYGGAIFSTRTSLNINNALFLNNQAYGGGAISTFNRSESIFNITNSTFASNQVEDEGGAIEGFDVPFNIENSIFELNPTPDGNQLAISPETSNINNSLILGGYEGAGENIIDADPLFVDVNNNNFSLREDSPAIDAGSNTAIEGIDTDLVGNSRITNETVDLGAYEFVLTSGDINETPDTPDTPETPNTPNNPETPDTPNNSETPNTPNGEPVYRFFIPDTGVHFYTTDDEERDEILENQPDYVLEGTPYSSAPADDSLTGVAPIYRFLNTDTGVRIYTIAEAERDSIETLSNYEPEGIAYYGYTEQLEDTTPVFRFYNPIIDAHFYTSSTVERDSVIANLPDYQLESNGGIAFYVEPIFNSETPISQPSDPETPADPSLPSSLGDILSQLIS